MMTFLRTGAWTKTTVKNPTVEMIAPAKGGERAAAREKNMYHQMNISSTVYSVCQQCKVCR